MGPSLEEQLAERDAFILKALIFLTTESNVPNIDGRKNSGEIHRFAMGHYRMHLLVRYDGKIIGLYDSQRVNATKDYVMSERMPDWLAEIAYMKVAI